MIKDERLVENLYDRTQNVAAYNDLWHKFACYTGYCAAISAIMLVNASSPVLPHLSRHMNSSKYPGN